MKSVSNSTPIKITNFYKFYASLHYIAQILIVYGNVCVCMNECVLKSVNVCMCKCMCICVCMNKINICFTWHAINCIKLHLNVSDSLTMLYNPMNEWMNNLHYTPIHERPYISVYVYECMCIVGVWVELIHILYFVNFYKCVLLCGCLNLFRFFFSFSLFLRCVGVCSIVNISAVYVC